MSKINSMNSGVIYLKKSIWLGDSVKAIKIKESINGIFCETRPNTDISLKSIELMFIPYSSIQYISLGLK